MMLARWLSIICLVTVLALPGAALAQGPNRPQDSEPTWHAAYWNNLSLSGEPVLEREEATLDHDWGVGSPGSAVKADGFSARWTRYLDIGPGTYRFTGTSDDGMRVYVDGRALINEWYDHAVKTVSADLTLSAGHHLVVVEFYEKTGLAVARLSWTPVEDRVQDWRGEYYNNTTISGGPVLVRSDTQINFDWGSGSPAQGVVNADCFSVRWTRGLPFKAGLYRFSMTIDDGGRLWVNEHLLIDAWRDQGVTTYTSDIYLPAGTASIKMEFYENQGAATAKLAWSLGSDKPSPGAIVVDNGDSGFVKGGYKAGWHTAYEGYGGDLLWTKNNDWVRSGYNWGRWYPGLKAGRYEVFVYIPDRYTTTAKARYWVSHADGMTLRIVNQSSNGGQWVSLGTYRFRGTRDDYVSLADVTFEPYLSRLIAWDAVKWERR